MSLHTHKDILDSVLNLHPHKDVLNKHINLGFILNHQTLIQVYDSRITMPSYLSSVGRARGF